MFFSKLTHKFWNKLKQTCNNFSRHDPKCCQFGQRLVECRMSTSESQLSVYQQCLEVAKRVWIQVVWSTWQSRRERAIANHHTRAQQHHDEQPIPKTLVPVQQPPEPHSSWGLRTRLFKLVRWKLLISRLLIQNQAQLQMPTQERIKCECPPCMLDNPHRYLD